MNYKITIEYEGTRYNGWQRQTSTPNTIQGIIEAAVKKVTNEDVEVNGSGRTDAGVHALGQIANFKTENEYEELSDSLNEVLPPDIKILSCERVNDRFHARLNAKAKTYVYKIDTGKKADVFTRRTVNHFNYDLDVDKMRKAAEKLLGEKDFKAFCSNRRTKKSTVRTIYSIDIEKTGSLITFTYKGDGFLYNMVRILTGTLVEVGMGKIPVDDIDKIINEVGSSSNDLIKNSRERGNAGMTLPPRGLTLVDVSYEEV
ncbi:MAG: tRNA pseudouridine(38-40) synthase TruA [Clostridia bacterium]|nr:tRNA pseudouridine(38-40) synthase TruA [Clostridia bacterium]